MPSFPNPFRRNESDGHPDLVDDEEDLVDDADSEWLAYELHEWASETRAMLAQLLIADQVPHSWQGTTLLAHESVEETVDALIEEVESAENTDLDPDKEQVAFEMEGWSASFRRPWPSGSALLRCLTSSMPMATSSCTRRTRSRSRW